MHQTVFVPKSVTEEAQLMQDSTPKTTEYKNRLASKIFREWQSFREVKAPALDPGGLFKDASNVFTVNLPSTPTEEIE
jgi:hypothetical protein